MWRQQTAGHWLVRRVMSQSANQQTMTHTYTLSYDIVTHFTSEKMNNKNFHYKLFLNAPWILSYTLLTITLWLPGNVVRSSCTWPVEGEGWVMFLPLPENAPNSLYWKIQTFCKSSVTSSIEMKHQIVKVLGNSLLLPIVRCFLCDTLVTIAHQHVLTADINLHR